MNNVVPIEFAASALDRRFAMSETNELYSISLPLGEGLKQERVLAHMVDRSSQSIRLIISDLDDRVCDLDPIGTELPQHYAGQLVGDLDEYLCEHSELVDQLMIGCIEHGSLTVARAVDAMRNGLGAQEATVLAVAQSRRCEAMKARHQKAVTDALGRLGVPNSK